MHSSTRAFFAFSAAALLVLSACPARAASGDAGVGAVFDISGSAGSYGDGQKNGLMLGQDYVNKNGRVHLTFDIEDAASQKGQAVNLFQSFTTGGKVAAIIGPTLSSEAFAADPIAVAAGMPVLGISNTANGVTAMGPCVFRDSLTEAAVVPHALKAVIERYHVKTAAIIYGNDDAFTKTDYEVAKAALDAQHVQIVSTQTFSKGDVDFQAQLTNIKGANPDLLFVGALAVEAGHIVSDAHTLGIKAHIVGGNGLNSPQVYSLSGGAAEGVVVGAAWAIGAQTPGNLDFVQAYRVRFLKDPDQFAAQAFAAAQIMENVLTAAKSFSPKDVCDAMKSMKPVNTVLGAFSFTGNRDASGDGVVLMVHNGRFVGF
ncbi:MAG TPA: ABC transporter substrate-binding protein [Candidatus Eremiobacteraceae bacterium]|nr:ABC transporter substrate-binding protein [Candidatus Eremiobacteraceae bacterium]